MNSQFTSHYFKIEIPELENRELLDKDLYFKIYGIENERPLVRINNNFYEGRWCFQKSFIIFTKNNNKIPELSVQSSKLFFVEKKKEKIKTIELKKISKSKKKFYNNIVVSKKLKLYRIPLIVKQTLDF